MNRFVTKLGLGVLLAATAVSAAVPADAQRFGGYHGGFRGYRGGYGYRGGIGPGGAAVLGGLVGLGVGAAIADGRRGYYAPGPGYYGPGPGYYGPGYYGYPGYYGPRCFTEWRRDYYGYRHPVRICD